MSFKLLKLYVTAAITCHLITVSSEKFDYIECQYYTDCVHILGSKSDCYNEVCGCMPGTHMDPTDHKCYTTLPLYVECQYDKNCLLKNGSYGICNGICDCGEGFRANRDMNDCVRSKNLGDLCVASEECSLIGHATCTGNTCLCEDGYSISMNGKFCLRDAENFGDSCEENVQCKKRLTDAICLEHLKTCGCPPTMHVHNITCIESFQLGDVCDRDEECEYTSDMIGKIKCVNYRCGCVDRSFCNSGSDPLSVTIFLFCVVLFVQHSLR